MRIIIAHAATRLAATVPILEHEGSRHQSLPPYLGRIIKATTIASKIVPTQSGTRWGVEMDAKIARMEASRKIIVTVNMIDPPR
jgi:hypothetical protein